MVDAFIWWLALFAIGLVAFPITRSLLRFLPDRGYALSRPLGLLIAVYLFWILGTAHLAPNTIVGVVIALLIVAAVSLRLVRRDHRALSLYFRKNWPFVLAVEAIWAATFVVWGIIRSHTAAIVHTEQPMDFALLNGILQSPHFPPQDPWAAGLSISYYYGGYLIAAFLTKLTAIPASVTYNLSLMSTAAMAAGGVFGLVYDLVRAMPAARQRGRVSNPPLRVARKSLSPISAMLCGLFAVFLLLFIGNLEGILEYARTLNLAGPGFFQWIRIDGLNAGAAPHWYPTDNWFWWRATRVINTFVNGQGIDYTINEFPFFSFLLGDMHPHVMAIPFDILALGLSLSVLRMRGTPSMAWALRHPWQMALLAMFFGSLGFINTWDLPTYLTVLLGAIVVRTFQAKTRGEAASYASALGLWLAVAIGALVLYAPFYANLSTQANGILPDRRVMTRPIQFLIVLGPLLLLSLIPLAVLGWRSFGETTRQRFAGLRRLPLPAPGLSLVEGTSLRSRATVATSARAKNTIGWLAFLPVVPFILWAAVEAGFGISGSVQLLYAGETASMTQSALAIGVRFWHVLPILAIASLALALVVRQPSRRPEESEGPEMNTTPALAGRETSLSSSQVLRPEASEQRPLFSNDDSASSNPSMKFVLLLISVAFTLALGAELFHVADQFGNRMNTVFKFYYQIWLLLTVAGAAGLAYWMTIAKRAGPLWRGASGALAAIIAVVVLAGFSYAPPAILDKTQHFAGPATLDGLDYVRTGSPDEYAAVQWLLTHSNQGDVIIEGLPVTNGQATGDYDPGTSRISTRTGLPTVLGWPGHEYQWRGGSYAPIQARINDVQTVYKTGTPAQVADVLTKYHVRYIVVGTLEKQTYGATVADRFNGIAQPVFMSTSGSLEILERTTP